MHNFSSISLLGIAILITFTDAFPSAAKEPVIGARPLGMGETFVAIADDGNALSWNPAGLPSLGNHEIASSYADLFGIGIKNNHIYYVFPIADHYAFGFDWAHLNFGDVELGYKKDRFRFSYGYKLWERISLGFGLTYLTTDMLLDSNSLGKASGWGLDLSMLYAPLEKLKIGMVIRDVTDTKVRYEEGRSDVIALRSFRFGGAYRPMENLTVALDVDDQLHFGGEYWLYNILGMRGGVQKDLHTSEPMTISCGTSIRYRLFQFDYSYVIPPTLPSSHCFSMSLSFDLYPSKVRIKDVDIEHLFPAFHKRYTEHPLGRVTLKNWDDEPHSITVNFKIPELMDDPTEQRLNIPQGATKEVSLNGMFSKNITTDQTEDIWMQAEVVVSYTTKQRTRSDKRSDRLFVYNRNATTWDDLRRVAAFITSTDPSIDGFARPTLLVFEEEIKELARAYVNVMRAMVLFNAVSQHGVRYIADPHNPYSQISADKSAVDNIQYPAEVLRKKSGDCDDLTSLYCALLENIGIHTALVDIPGHIFMMFDSGVSIENSYTFPIDGSLYVIRNGNLWIPVEATLFRKSFIEAWQSGARECVRFLEEQDTLRVIDTSNAWKEYEPSPPNFEGEVLPPTKEDLQDAFSSDYLKLKEIMESYVSRTYLTPLKEHPGNLELRFELARVYTGIREYERSISQYQRLFELDADPARVFNNMGIAYLYKGEEERAIESIERAMELDPADKGIKYNHKWIMSRLAKKEGTKFTGETGISVPKEGKGAEFEVDKDSFYWRE